MTEWRRWKSFRGITTASGSGLGRGDFDRGERVAAGAVGGARFTQRPSASSSAASMLASLGKAPGPLGGPRALDEVLLLDVMLMQNGQEPERLTSGF